MKQASFLLRSLWWFMEFLVSRLKLRGLRGGCFPIQVFVKGQEVPGVFYESKNNGRSASAQILE